MAMVLADSQAPAVAPQGAPGSAAPQGAPDSAAPEGAPGSAAAFAPRPVVIVACGSRELPWSPVMVRQSLLAAAGCRPVIALFHGGARGADQLADQEARALGWSVRVRMAQWSVHGIAAGPIRNRQMLEHAGALAAHQGADLVLLAFPGGKGTASCIREARRWHRLSDRRVLLEVNDLGRPEAAAVPGSQAEQLQVA